MDLQGQPGGTPGGQLMEDQGVSGSCPETGKLRDCTGTGRTDGLRRRNGREAGWEGQDSLSRVEVNPGGLAGQLPPSPQGLVMVGSG